MILFQNSLVTLDYDPATDILSLKWPDLQKPTISEVKQTLKLLVDNIKYYDVKKLLVDSSQTTVEVEDAEYKEVMFKFIYDIINTRLQKFARVMSNDALRENNVTQLRVQTNFPIPFQNFTDASAALAWLKQ